MRIHLLLWSCLLCLICACQSEEDKAWEEAIALNSSAAIDSFLLRYPGTKYADDADAQKEDYAWYAAKQKNTVYHYKKYLVTYPSGQHAAKVPEQLEAIPTDEINIDDLTQSTFIGKINYGNRETQVLAFRFLEVEKSENNIGFKARIQTSDINKVIEGRIDPKGSLIMFMENNEDTIMLNITDVRIYKQGNKLLLESTNVNQYWNLIKYTEE